MGKIIALLGSLLLLACEPLLQREKTPISLFLAIYGEDHRQEIASAPPPWRKLSHSIAAQIHHLSLSLDGDSYIPLPGNWKAPLNYCADEAFYGQPRVAHCTGFLIAPDKMLTASHCLPSCPHFLWVFDYTHDAPSIPRQNVYSCHRSETIHPSLTYPEGFGIVYLDRPVSDRPPLTLRTTGSLSEQERVVLIGHPMGLPLKIDAGPLQQGNLLIDNTPPHYFTAPLDSYTGNSGSPVFNARTGSVEGVLVGGEEDFIYDSPKNCHQSQRCSIETCQGETVLRITSLLDHEDFRTIGNIHSP